ncbi:MAG: TolC family protein [Rhodocyclaceae bacterium]|nr:TolC family protein [Rhodocyclaceae bacterium]
MGAPFSAATVGAESRTTRSTATEAGTVPVKKATTNTQTKKKKSASQTKAKAKSKTKAKVNAKAGPTKQVAERQKKKKKQQVAGKTVPVAKAKQAAAPKTAPKVKNVAYSAPPSGQWPASAFNPAAYPTDQSRRGDPVKLAALSAVPKSGETSATSAKPTKSTGPANHADAKSSRNQRNDLAQKSLEPAGKPAEAAKTVVNDSPRKNRSDPAAQGVSFDVLAHQTLATHPGITAKRASLEAAKADLAGANWQRFPTPSIEAGAGSGQGGFGTFRVQQPIWTGGRISAGIEGADAHRKAAEVGIAEAQRELLQRLVSAFAEAQRQQARQDIARKGVREHEKLLGLIERRVEQQVSPPVDQTFAKARTLQASNELSVVTQALSNALTQLSQLSGQQVSRVAPMSTTIADLPADRAAALEQATRSSPVLARIGYEEEAAGADITSKKSGYMPQVSVRYERASNSAINNLGNTDRLMLVLEAQPGAGLSAGAGVDSATAKREAIRRSRDMALIDIQEKVTTDWNDLMASRQRLESTLQGQRVANEVFDSYARQFTTGKKTWIDVLNSVRESTQAELAVADAEGQVIAAALRLKLVTGTLDIGQAN